MEGFVKWLTDLIKGIFAPDTASAAPTKAGGARPAPAPTPPPKALPKPGLQKPGGFYDEIRRQKLFGPVFSTSEFEGCEEVLKDCVKAKWTIAEAAYALATAYHETAHTMQPIKEYGGYEYYMHNYDITGKDPARARRYGNTTKGDGAKYCGRGYVQLTWKVNYAKAGRALGIDLVNVPDLAMNPDYASDIMVLGMTEGWFTGRKFRDFLPRQGKATKQQFVHCRLIINGTDKAELIAQHAMDFQKALELGQWK